ncbi:hypothetical protein [Frankia sp. AgB32]|uniref:FMN-binding protein n=1 Tax=Frankia sp. AgB32 TaxID=631119 RepID=UPI00200DC831|nr:hypothetical protein [Frankia sp. AgB32]MCK9895731.1 hypothetical protein [Frankia sp. AgB32]
MSTSSPCAAAVSRIVPAPWRRAFSTRTDNAPLRPGPGARHGRRRPDHRRDDARAARRRALVADQLPCRPDPAPGDATAQSATIDAVSGASYTSDGWRTSPQAALNLAGHS